MDVTGINDSLCIFPISSQDHKAPSGWRGKYVCFSHTMNEEPLYLRVTKRAKILTKLQEMKASVCKHYMHVLQV